MTLDMKNYIYVPYVLNRREYDENCVYSENVFNVFNVPTIMTERVTSVIVATGAVLAPSKRGLRWGRNFEGQFGGRHEKRAVQSDIYVLIKHLFYDRGKLQKILTKLACHRKPRPHSELIMKIGVPINILLNLSEDFHIAALNPLKTKRRLLY